MHSPEVEKALLTGEWTEETAAESEADDDPIIAEIRRHRREIMAEFDYDFERYRKHLLVRIYACGRKVVSSDWRDPHGPEKGRLGPELCRSFSAPLHGRTLRAGCRQIVLA